MRTMMKALRTVFETLSMMAMIGSGALLQADPSEATIVTPSGPIAVLTNQAVSFTASSTDSGWNDSYRVNSYKWNFGDGTPMVTGSGPSGVASHAYASPGTYTTTLTVSYTVGQCTRPAFPSGCMQYSYTTLTATATRVITVLAPPSISSFSASPSTVRAGQPVTLSWSTSTATRLSISGVGTVTGTSVVVYPTASTTYTLTASNAAASTTASTAVSVYTVSVSISPTSSSIPLGGSQAFSASVTPPNQGVSWSATGGSMSGGTFIGTASGTYTVKATSLEDPGKSANATVTVASVSVGTPSPANATVNAGSSLQYSASVSGAVNTGVTWYVSGGGTISSGGLFNADTAGTYTVTATSAADPSKSASTQVTVASVVTGVSIDPTSASLKAGETKTFTAAVSGLGGASTAVTWSAPGGNITSGGVYTAPIAGGTYTVTATSVQDGSKKASATVTVSGISVSTPSPANASVDPGGTIQYSAAASGGVNTAVTWSVSGGGNISSSGLFSATTAGSYTVTAASSADPTKTASTTVKVKGWALKLKRDVVYVGTKEVAEVDAQGAVRITLVDHLGSPRFLVGPTGVLESTQKYLPFGESLADPTSAAKFAKGFTNHEQTDPSGLIYMQARFYAPWYGRFLSPDPARDQHFEETQSWNIYSYVRNQPTMAFDPNGMNIAFAVDPKAASGNGHTTLYFQGVSGKWFSYNQGAAGETSSGQSSVGFLLGLSAKAGVSIEVAEPPKGAVQIETSPEDDQKIAQSAFESQAGHNSGDILYNLYSNSCTDASVDVVNNSGASVKIPNPALTLKPNTWFKQLKVWDTKRKEEQKKKEEAERAEKKRQEEAKKKEEEKKREEDKAK